MPCGGGSQPSRASTSSGALCEKMQMPGPHPRIEESESELGADLDFLCVVRVENPYFVELWMNFNWFK